MSMQVFDILSYNKKVIEINIVVTKKKLILLYNFL